MARTAKGFALKMITLRRVLLSLLLSAALALPALALTRNQLVAVLTPPPPVLDLNFATMSSLPGSITFTRASSATTAFYTDAAAKSVTSFSSGVPRLNSNGTGLLIERSATNYLLNSGSPATQTTGSLSTGTYVLFGNGTGSIVSSAGTATATGLGTLSSLQGNFQTINVTVAGTLTFTVSGSVNWFDLQGQSFPTSHIVTAGATATRGVDSATLTNAGLLAGLAVHGTMIAKGTSAAGLSAEQDMAQIDDGTNSNLVLLGRIVSSTLGIANTYSGGTPEASLGINSFASATLGTQAVSWGNGSAGAANFGQSNSYNSASGLLQPATINRLQIGNGRNGVWNGWVQRIQLRTQVYTKAQLIAGTAAPAF